MGNLYGKIFTEFILDNDKAKSSVDEFTNYAKKEIEKLNNELKLDFTSIGIESVRKAVGEITELFSKLGDISVNVKADGDKESSLREYTQLETAIADAKVEMTELEQVYKRINLEMKDGTKSMTEQGNLTKQAVDANRELSDAYKLMIDMLSQRKDELELIEDGDKEAVRYIEKQISYLETSLTKLDVEASNFNATLQTGLKASARAFNELNFDEKRNDFNRLKTETDDFNKVFRNTKQTTNDVNKEYSEYVKSSKLLEQQIKNNITVLQRQQAQAKDVPNTYNKIGKEIEFYYRQLSNLNNQQNVNNRYYDDVQLKIAGTIDKYAQFNVAIGGVSNEIRQLTNDFNKQDATMDEKKSTLTKLNSAYDRQKSVIKTHISNLKSEQSATESGSKAYSDLQAKIDKYEKQIIDADKVTRDINYTFDQTSLKLTAQQNGYEGLSNELNRTALMYGGLYTAMRQAQNVFNSKLEVNKSMTEFAKVAQLSNDEMQDFKDYALESADALGVVATSVIDATGEFVRLGIAVEDAKGFAELATKGAMVGDIGDVTQVTDYLISALKGYKDLNVTVDDATKVLDMFNNVANNTSINFEAIGEGVTRFASSMSIAGNSIEESIGLLVGGYDVTRNAEKTATALNTISMRMRGINDEGEEQLDLVPAMEKKFNEYNITLRDANGEMKSSYQIMKELSAIWSDLSKMDQSFLLESIAGKRQANVAGAIIENWNSVEDAISKAVDSAGSADREYQYYMDGMESATNQFKNSLVALYDRIASDETIIGLIDGATSLVNTIADLDPAFFKFVTTLAVGQAGAFALTKGIDLAVKGFNGFKSTLTMLTTTATGTTTAMSLLNKTIGVVGMLPLIISLTVAVVDFVARLDIWDSKAEKLEKTQQALNDKVSQSQSVLENMKYAIDNVTESYDAYGNKVQEIDSLAYWETVNELKDLYPELASSINEVASAYENKYDSLSAIQDLVNESNAEDQLEILNGEQEILSELQDEYDELVKKKQEYAENYKAEIALYGDATTNAGLYRDALSTLDAQIGNNSKKMSEQSIRVQEASDRVADLGYKLEFVNGVWELSSFTIADYNARIDALNLSTFDLTDASGALAQAFIELMTMGELTSGTIDALSQFFDKNTISALNDADAVLAFADANNLSARTLLADNNQVIASSKQKVQAYIDEMKAKLKLLEVEEAFLQGMGDTGEAERAYRESLQIKQHIANAEAYIKNYERLTTKISNLSGKRPTIDNSSTSSSSSNKKPSSSSSSSSNSSSSKPSTSTTDKEEAIDWSKKFEKQLYAIAQADHALALAESKLDVATNDGDRYKQMTEKSKAYGQQLNALKDYQKALTDEMKKHKVGSDEYKELESLLQGVELELLGVIKAQQDYNAEIRDFNREISEFKNAELDYNIAVIENALKDENLSLEEKIALYEQMNDLYAKQAENKKAYLKTLYEELDGLDKNSEAYRELQQEIWDLELDILNLGQAQKDVNKDIYDAVKKANDELYQAEKDRVDKTIELIKKERDEKVQAIKDQIDAMKDKREEDEYEAQRQEVIDDIDSLKAKYKRLESDDSLWAKQQRKALEEQIKEKEKQLKEMEEKRAFDLEIKRLQEEQNKITEEANEKIDALNQGLADYKEKLDGISTTLNTSATSLKSIATTLSNMIKGSSPTISSRTYGNLGTQNTNTIGDIHINITGVDSNTGVRTANDFITTLQQKGIRFRR